MAEQSFGIELRAGADVSEFRRELKAAQGDVEQLGKVIEHFKRQAGDVATGQDVLITFQGVDATSSTVKVVESSLNKYSGTLKGTIAQLNKISGAERRSVTSLSQKLSFLKQTQGRVDTNSKKYKILEKAINKYTTALKNAKGIQQGSIADLNEQAQKLEKLASIYKIGSVEQIKYANQAKRIRDEIKKSTNPLSKFFSVLNRIATVQAGFTAIAAVVQTFTGSLNKFIGQTKALEGFELALKNIGLSSIEVNDRLQDASKIANELGAPLEQVEKSFKRMVPALEAVGVNAKDSTKFLQGVAARTQTLGLNTEQTGRFMEAFAQVLSKGKLQAEELNQQISELDGAFRGQLAEALGVTTRQLEDMIKNGEVTSQVFVKAFNNMANGADELRRRIEKGNATVQQIQNLINNIQVDNLRTIGAAIEPGTKAIFSIQLAIEDFINSISKSETGKLLATVFNEIAIGVKEFVKAITNAVKAVNVLIEPISLIINKFGFLIRGLTIATAALISFKAALAIKALLVAVSGSVNLVTTALVALKVALLAISSNIAFSVFLALIKTKVVALLVKFAPLLAAFAKFAIVALPAAGALKAFQDNAEKAEQRTNEFTSKVQEAIDKLKDVPDAVDEANDSLGRFGKPKIPLGDPGKFQSGRVGPLPGSFAEASLAFDDPTQRLKDVFEQQKNLNDELRRTGVLTKNNTIDIDNFSKMATSDLRRLLDGTTKYTEGLQEQKDEMGQLEKGARKAGVTNVKFFNSIKDVIEAIDVQNPGLRLLLSLLEQEIDKRKDSNIAMRDTVSTMEELNTQIKEQADAQKLIETFLQNKYMEKFGEDADTASEKTLALASALYELAQTDLTSIQNQIKEIQKRKITEDFTKDEQGNMLMVLQQQLLEAENEVKKASNEINEIVQEDLERTFSEIKKTADGYKNLAEAMRSGAASLASSAKGALTELRSLADEVFSNMKKGRSPADQEKIEIQRLRFLAEINDLEQAIIEGRITAEHTIAKIKNASLQAELRQQQTLAAGRGDQAAVADFKAQIEQSKQLDKNLDNLYKLELARAQVNGIIKDEKIFQAVMATKLYSNLVGVGNREKKITREFGLQRADAEVLQEFFQRIQRDGAVEIFKTDKNAIETSKQGLEVQLQAYPQLIERAEKLKGVVNQTRGTELAKSLGTLQSSMAGATSEAFNFEGALGRAYGHIQNIISALRGSSSARFMGGPVEAGQTYRVNDAGFGREAFMNKFGDIKMLPAASNIDWTAPSSGTIIPARLVKIMQKNADINSKLANRQSDKIPKVSMAAAGAINNDSGNLMKQLGSAVSGSTSNRITNNVTIQSQSPVRDASDLMTNVARMRLRNSRRI